MDGEMQMENEEKKTKDGVYRGCNNCANRKRNRCLKGYVVNCFRMTCKGGNWEKRKK